MTKREDFNEMRDSVMQEAGYWLNDYIDEETMHDDNETMLDAAGRLLASFMAAMSAQEKLDDPLPRFAQVTDSMVKNFKAGFNEAKMHGDEDFNRVKQGLWAVLDSHEDHREYARLVTIKLPRNKNHNPHNKITAECPVSTDCTDSTGEHHTVIVYSDAEVEGLRATFGHITRIEEVGA